MVFAIPSHQKLKSYAIIIRDNKNDIRRKEYETKKLQMELDNGPDEILKIAQKK